MLTVEELKTLELGDWVWIEIETIEYIHKVPLSRCYVRKVEYAGAYNDEVFTCSVFGDCAPLLYVDYGTKWVAFKNKEEAEGKSIILPCKVGDTVYMVQNLPFNGIIKYKISGIYYEKGEVFIDGNNENDYFLHVPIGEFYNTLEEARACQKGLKNNS